MQPTSLALHWWSLCTNLSSSVGPPWVLLWGLKWGPALMQPVGEKKHENTRLSFETHSLQSVRNTWHAVRKLSNFNRIPITSAHHLCCLRKHGHGNRAHQGWDLWFLQSASQGPSQSGENTEQRLWYRGRRNLGTQAHDRAVNARWCNGLEAESRQTP